MPLLHKIAGLVIVCAVILGLVLPRDERGAGPEPAAARAAARSAPQAAGDAPARPARQERTTPARPSPSVTAIAQARPEAARIRANELGQIPVLMYHRIVKKPEMSLDRSVQEFRDELIRLAKSGYVPITAGEFAAGRIDVPAGRHPVVLTFDDSTPGHFALDAGGNPAPDTAVSVLLEVARQYPGFRPTATFYLNKDPFQLGDRTAQGLQWLVRHGFELGNHTLSHKNLAEMSRSAVEKEIGDIEGRIASLAGVHTTTLAYPFGSEPKQAAWAQAKAGSYRFNGIFLAGWRPSESPFSRDFDWRRIPRVRSEGKIAEDDCTRYCSIAWLDWLDKNPAERYISDGDPNTISFPRTAEGKLASRFRAYARAY
ncbi:polysaccharide deacetylase family protein [Actinomadura keratinilytica]|uniref:Polysaccharide deacetylase family protein n=1 Tax=Actinomadura keratinilytica TaxID=547461 RepID=A0ABP7YJP1_9ACTN